MNKPQLKLKVLPVAILALLVPSSFAFGFSFIDLGLMDGSTRVVAQESRDVDAGAASRSEEVSTRNITVSRTQINGDSEGFPSITPDTVDSEESLQLFASSTVFADASIESITFTSDRVELVYKYSERLLAFMPVNFHVKAITYSEAVWMSATRGTSSSLRTAKRI